MLGDLLPPAVRVAEVGGGDVDDLLPGEAAALGPVGAVRRRDYAAGRHCARRACAGLGLPAAPLLPGADGAPRWPAAVVGSLTHCAGYAAAAVAHRRDLRAVGVDAEPARPLPQGVLRRVTCAAERVHLAALPAGVPWDTVLFSAKESVYKAWSPITGRWLGFTDATLTIQPRAGTFTARVLVPGPPRFTGRFTVRDGLILTAVTVDP